MKIIKCPICESDDLSDYFKKEHNNKTYTIDICKNCGVFFVNPQPDDSVLSNLYSESYFTSRNYESKDKYRINISKKRISQIRKGIKASFENAKILEIGCAMGHFLKCLKDLNAEVYGVELSEYAATRGKEKFNIEIFPGNLEKSNLIHSKYDFIFGWDLFEHLKNPNNFLKLCHNILKKHGYLIIHIPYTDSIGYKIYRNKWKKINPEEHLFYYNYNGIKHLAEKNSFILINLPFSILKFTDYIFNNTKTFILQK